MTSHHSGRGPRFPWRAVPGIRAMSSYRREWLVKDLVAGVVPTMLPLRRAWCTPSWRAS